jgi:hypothetical protein
MKRIAGRVDAVTPTRLAFGAPDAAHPEPAETDDEQLSYMAGAYIRVGPAHTARTRSAARVVYGRRGTGKSHRLKAMAAESIHRGGVATGPPDNDPPSTEFVKDITMRAGTDAQDVWEALWTKAILLAGASQILSMHRGDRETQRLAATYRVLLDHPEQPRWSRRTPYSMANWLLSRYQTPTAIRTFSKKIEWSTFEDELALCLDVFSPVSFFLDGIDEAEHKDPVGWMACQQGLLEAVTRLASISKWRHLRTVVAMRESQVNVLISGNNGEKWKDSPFLEHLVWDGVDCRRFLEAKIDRLDPAWLTDPKASDPMRRWLGVAEVRNEQLDVIEPAASYILRHTMLVPRDIVVMGNVISRELRRLMPDHSASSDSRQAAIRRGVHIAAQQVANTALGIAAVDMARAAYAVVDSAPSTSGDTVQSTLRKRLIALLGRVGSERPSRAEVQGLIQDLDDEFGAGVGSETFASLWRLRVLGVSTEDGKGASFYGWSAFDTDALPVADVYVFHACVIDLCRVHDSEMTAIGPFPVYPSGDLG